MEKIKNSLKIYKQLRSCTSLDELETLKKNLRRSNIQSNEVEKETDPNLSKNSGNKELGILNIGKSGMLLVADARREVDNLIKEVKELANRGKFGDNLTLEVHEEMQVQFPTSNLVGENFGCYMNEIFDLLITNKSSTIGVWGMGGVGKTTLIRHLHNMMLAQPQIYGSVYWITVSKDCSMQKLQYDIAERIGESFSTKLDESQRAGILANALKRKKKFVLILDDMWSDYDLNEVGLGVPKEIGYRLIISSRSNDVCLKMYCDNIIKVDTLSKNDAWTLFVRSIGREIPDDLTKISTNVLEECRGLPLGIITLAKSMMGCNDVYEWTNVLDELRSSSGKVDDMEEKVFNVLRLSFERLKDSELKECFLHCATYPEDSRIEIDELIWLFIDAGLLGQNVGMAKMFDKGLAILRKLERVALLSIEDGLYGEWDYVRLHDLIRDMALQIAGSRFTIKSRIGLKCIPDEESWTNKVEVVSLMSNEIEEVYDSSPKCNRLRTLLLQRNYSLSMVCDGFFRYLHGLKLLELSESGIRTLPESISVLKNLTALILRHCEYLENVPSLAKLTSLERLDLYETNISELPKGIGCLIKLRYLNFLCTKIRRIEAGVISKLIALQYLAFEARIDAKELSSLKNLEHLSVVYVNLANFSTFIQQMKFKGRPNSYTYLIGNFEDDHPINMTYSIWSEKRIYLRKAASQIQGNKSPSVNQYNQLHKVLPDIHLLDISEDENMMSLGDFVFETKCNLQRQPEIERGAKPFSNLRSLKLYACSNLKKMFPSGLMSNLQNIEEIKVDLCEGLEELIEKELDDSKLGGIKDLKIFCLPKLKRIHLEYLPSLKSLCSDDKVIHAPSLEWILITRCPKLKRMPFDVDTENRQFRQMFYLEHEKKWFDLLEWDPLESKSMMTFSQCD